MTKLTNCRILITGCQGQVGFELIKSLSNLGAELVLAYRNPKSNDGFGYQSVAMDLADEESVRSVIRSVKPNILINPAAYTAVDKAESESALAYLVNQKSVGVMAYEMQKLNGAIIHFSTDYVYNSDHDHGNSESDETKPANVYAASKLAGELELGQARVPHIILRTSWVYGVNGNNFVKTMLKLGRERDALKIVDDQIGSPTSAVTLAHAVSSLLLQGREDPVAFIQKTSGIYNISDHGFTSWLGFAKEIFQSSQALGFELRVKDVQGIPTAQYKTPALRPFNSRMNHSKIESVFGIRTPNWERSLKIFLHEIQLKLL